MITNTPSSDSPRDNPYPGPHPLKLLEQLSRRLRAQGFRDHDVEDTLQEVQLMSLGRTRSDTPSNSEAYLYTVARNAARKSVSRRRERNVETLPEPWTFPLNEIDEAEERQYLLGAIRAAVEGLSPLRREIIHLRYFVGMTIREAATSLGLREGVVRGHLKLSLKTMKLHLRNNKEFARNCLEY